jgi:hypothetical protein
MGILFCKIELDKVKGATITIDNPDAKISQTVSLDGTSLTLKVVGDKATSTYVQTQDQIHVTVDDFRLDAKTITITSSQASSWKSEDTFCAESSKDLTLKTSSKLNAEAAGDAKLSGDNTTLLAKSAATIEGMNTTVKGSTALKGEGAKVEFKSTGQAGFEGAVVKVKASGMLTAEASGVATFKGAVTNIQGSLVKIG